MRRKALAHISTEGPSTSQQCHVTSHRVGRDKCGLTALLHSSLTEENLPPGPALTFSLFARIYPSSLPPLGPVSVTSWAVGCPVLCSAGEADHVRTSGEEPDRESQVVGEGEKGVWRRRARGRTTWTRGRRRLGGSGRSPAPHLAAAVAQYTGTPHHCSELKVGFAAPTLGRQSLGPLWSCVVLPCSVTITSLPTLCQDRTGQLKEVQRVVESKLFCSAVY